MCLSIRFCNGCLFFQVFFPYDVHNLMIKFLHVPSNCLHLLTCSNSLYFLLSKHLNNPVQLSVTPAQNHVLFEKSPLFGSHWSWGNEPRFTLIIGTLKTPNSTKLVYDLSGYPNKFNSLWQYLHSKIVKHGL